MRVKIFYGDPTLVEEEVNLFLAEHDKTGAIWREYPVMSASNGKVYVMLVHT